MDLLDMLLDDMHLRGAALVEVDLAEDVDLSFSATAAAMFHVVIAGTARLRVAGEERNRLLKRGDVVVLPGGLAHRIGNGREQVEFRFPESDAKLLSYGSVARGGGVQLMFGHARFDAELARPLVMALPAVLHIASDGVQIPPWIAIGLEFIRQELRAELPAQQAVVNRMADILVIECLRRYVADIPEDAQTWLRALLDPALSRALAALHADPARNWSVESLARMANLSRSSFAQRFRRCMGQTPMQYLTGHRLRKASWQLRHTAQPIAHIAEAAGYASSSAFTQAFDRNFGMSPRAYRDAAHVGDAGLTGAQSEADQAVDSARLRQ